MSYFSACNTGLPHEISDYFTMDARIYDTNHPPVLGRDAIGHFWVHVRRKWGNARWHIDTLVEDNHRVAVEWTMKGTYRDRAFVLRGSDHYEFEGDFIKEVRQYWTLNENSPAAQLLEYPYQEDPRFA